MKGYGKIVAIILVVILLFTIPSIANAYEIMYISQVGAYTSGLQNYIVYQSWSGFAQETRWAIDYASNQWNSRTGVTKLYHSATQHNRGNIISVEDGSNLITKAIITDSEAAAMRTTNYFRQINGKWYIIESDIVIDGTWPWYNNGSSKGLDVQNSITHELGHMLGLGHSTVTSATMYPSCTYGDISRRTLEQDDLNGFDYLY